MINMVVNMIKLAVITLIILLASSHLVEAAPVDITDWEHSRFNELDINNDSVLGNVEFRGTTAWMSESGYSEKKQIQKTNQKFNNYDTNKDSKVSIEEFVTGNRASKASATKNQKAKKVDKGIIKKSNSMLTIGDTAPNYLGTDTDGDEVNIDELKGKIVVVSFWVSWCKHCKNELAILQNIQNKVGNDLLKVVAINYKENRRSYNKFKKQLSALNLTLTHDKRGNIGKKYGVEKAPNIFIIGKDGKIIFMDSKYNQTPVNAVVDIIKNELST